jgi:hypothetical protein
MKDETDSYSLVPAIAGLLCILLKSWVYFSVFSKTLIEISDEIDIEFNTRQNFAENLATLLFGTK